MLYRCEVSIFFTISYSLTAVLVASEKQIIINEKLNACDVSISSYLQKRSLIEIIQRIHMYDFEPLWNLDLRIINISSQQIILTKKLIETSISRNRMEPFLSFVRVTVTIIENTCFQTETRSFTTTIVIYYSNFLSKNLSTGFNSSVE